MCTIIKTLAGIDLNVLATLVASAMVEKNRQQAQRALTASLVAEEE